MLTHHNEKKAFSSLSTPSNFDKGRKGNPKHKTMGRTYKPNQGQCLKCFCNLWQFFSALIARQESVKRKWDNFSDCLQHVLEGTGNRASLFRYGSLILSHIRFFFFFSKTKTSIDLKMAKQPAKHVESHNIARDRD